MADDRTSQFSDRRLKILWHLYELIAFAVICACEETPYFSGFVLTDYIKWPVSHFHTVVLDATCECGPLPNAFRTASKQKVMSDVAGRY